MNNSKEEKEKDDFSFVKMCEIINKTVTGQTTIGDKNENAKKLKFEPNMNVARIQNPESNLQPSPSKPDEQTGDLIQDIARKFQNESSLAPKKPVKKETQRKATTIVSEEDILQDHKTTAADKKQKFHDKEEYNLKSIISNFKQKDPTAYVPIILPFKEKIADDHKNVAKELYADPSHHTLKEEDCFIFQFPRVLPFNLEIQEKQKLEEIQNEEPVHDSYGNLIKPEFQNVFKELPRNSKLGKLKVFKSGKVKMQIGDVLYDVDNGVNCKFAEEFAVVTGEDTNEAFFLGRAREKKLVVTPQLNFIK